MSHHEPKNTAVTGRSLILVCSSLNELDESVRSSLHAPRHQAMAKGQRGISLIELMIALLIGAFFLGGVVQIFANTKQTYRMVEASSRLQENGRFAMEFLARDIRMAGFLGCNGGINPTNTLESPAAFTNSVSPATALQGFEATAISPATWVPAIDAAITSPLAGSDVITLRRAGETGFRVASHGSPPSNTAPLTLAGPPSTADLQNAGFLGSASDNQFAAALVSDCGRAAVFRITRINGADLLHADCSASPADCVPAPTSCVRCNTTADLGSSFGASAEVYPVHTISYYVRNNAVGTPSLYRRTNLNDAEELVEGVESMQIRYGIDNNADGVVNFYVPFNSVSNSSQIVAVRISLLLQTIDDNVTDAPLGYAFNGANVVPVDRRLRRVFTTTLAIRNRLP